MKAFIGILIVFNIYFASSLPVPESTVHQNPCTPKALYEVQYYHFCPMHDNKYIICDPWGGMQMEECPSGSKWIKESVECVFSNATEEWTRMLSNAEIEKDLIMMPNISATFENFTCSFYGEKSCLNGGMCVRSDQDYRCLCLDEFSGRFCEVKGVKSTGVFGLLINSTPTLDTFNPHRPELVHTDIPRSDVIPSDNINTPTDFLGQFNQTIFNTSILSDSLVKNKIDAYLSMFGPTAIRFDELVINYLRSYVSILSNNEYFVSDFLSEDKVKISLPNAITNLLYASKYQYDSLDKFFAIYDQVISNFVKYLGDKEPKSKEQAQAYFAVFEVVKPNLKIYTNWVSENLTQANLMNTSELIKQLIYKRFNESLGLSYEFYKYLNEFKDRLSYKVQLENSIDTDMIEMSINNFTSSSEVSAKFGKIYYCSLELWDLWTFYGFSRVLSQFIAPVNHVFARETMNDETVLKDKSADNSTIKVLTEEEEEDEQRRDNKIPSVDLLNNFKSDNKTNKVAREDEEKNDEDVQDRRSVKPLNAQIPSVDKTVNAKINKTDTEMPKKIK